LFSGILGEHIEDAFYYNASANKIWRHVQISASANMVSSLIVSYIVVPWAVLHDVPNVPGNVDPTWHEAREGRVGPAQHGPSPSSTHRFLALPVRDGNINLKIRNI